MGRGGGQGSRPSLCQPQVCRDGSLVGGREQAQEAPRKKPKIVDDDE